MSDPRNILAALKRKCGFEHVTVNASDKQLRIEGRVRDAATNLNSKNWTILKTRLCLASRGKAWSVDISKHFFVPEGGARLMFAWRIIFHGESLAQNYPFIAGVIDASPTANSGEVTEIALAGTSADRNNTAGGRRGAGFEGRVAVGPLALQARLLGG